MHNHFTIPFQTFRLILPGENPDTFFPLGKESFFSFGKDDLDEDYRDYLQHYLLDSGNYSALLDHIYPELSEKDSFSLQIPPSNDGFSHPELTLDIVFYYASIPGGFWGIAPVFGVKASSSTLEGLKKQLAEIIRIKLRQSKRFKSVSGFLAAIWYKDIIHNKSNLVLKIPSPRAQDEQKENTEFQFISSVCKEVLPIGEPLFGMEEVLGQVLRAMRLGPGKSILIVGPEGVGKSALIAETARMRYLEEQPGTIYATSATTLIQELTLNDGWQYNLSIFCRELLSIGAWLYIRNFGELFEVGRYEGNDISIGQYLRNYLGRGEISLISECTQEELQYIESISPNITSLFTVIKVFPPADKTLESIVQQKVAVLSGKSNQKIEPEAIREAVRLHKRYNPYSGMPGRVIRFLERLLTMQANDKNTTPKNLTAREIVRSFCEEQDIPQVLVADDVPFRIPKVESFFRTKIYGQDAAVSAVVAMLVKEKMKLSGTHKPIASFLFVGPTGVGKTELAKALTTFVFGNANRMTRFDMSEFSGEDAVFRLTGGGQSEGLLTSAVRRAPFSVILFDEIEKAAPAFFSLLLQILDQGRLTDFRGNLVNFCSSIIVMTSNIGADGLKRMPIQLKNRGKEVDDLKLHYHRAVEKKFPPELVNRFDEIIPFATLDQNSIRYIVDRELQLLQERDGIRFQYVKLTVEDDVRDYLTKIGFHPLYGARFLQRTIHNELVLPLAKVLNEKDVFEKILINIKINPQTGKPELVIHQEKQDIKVYFQVINETNNHDNLSRIRLLTQKMSNSAMFHEASWMLKNLMKERDNPQSKSYWKDGAHTEKLEKLESFFKNYQIHKRDVFDLEIELQIEFLTKKLSNGLAKEHYAKVLGDFCKLLVDLNGIIHPENNRAYLMLIGDNLQIPSDFYLQLFNNLDLKIEIFQVYESLSENKEIPSQTSKKHNSKADSLLDIRFESMSKSADFWKKTQNPKVVRLLGLIFSLSGFGASILLKDENGVLEWELPNGKTEKCCVETAQIFEKIASPELVREMLKPRGKPRRYIGNDRWKDTIYRIEKAKSLSDFQDAISEILNQRLGVEFMGGIS